MQEFSIPPDSPGLGRAATKTAMEAAKRASLENIVKTRVGGFASCELRDKDEVGIRTEETRITQRRGFISFFFPDTDWIPCGAARAVEGRQLKRNKLR